VEERLLQIGSASFRFDGSLERALLRYVRPELLVVDDFAVLAMDPAQAKLAFQVIRALRPPARDRHHHQSAIQGLDEGLPRRSQRSGHSRRVTERSELFLLGGNGFRNPQT